ncbi:MAG: allantoate amidohydrolase [Acidimicrobiia bacterium]|nr:allantoate amidohydrolase [Acidimicrobiia bacterium]
MTSIELAADVVQWCRRLAACSETPGETRRPFLSPPMREVHEALAGWMRRLGMDVRIDAAGNLRGVYAAAGSAPGAAAGRRLFIGSHLDTVPNAGAFDGVLGVVLGIALVEHLRGRRLPFAIEVVGFSDEEGVRFGVPFIGSRALTGLLDDAVLACRDLGGRTVEDAIRDFGLDPARIPDAAAPDGSLGYLEFHIEQGPILENLNLPLAVVDAVAGQTRADVWFTGQAGHAGTTPMTLRRDGLAGAAVWIAEVEREAIHTSGLVATVGRVAVEPGAANVIPGRCELSLDVRHAADDVRTDAVGRLRRAAEDIASRRGLAAAWQPRLEQPSVRLDAELSSLLARALETAGFRAHRMTSGAGHDAMIVAGRMPAGMVFLRCAGGISHHPAESVREDDVAAALEAGLGFLNALERSHG